MNQLHIHRSNQVFRLFTQESDVQDLGLERQRLILEHLTAVINIFKSTRISNKSTQQFQTSSLDTGKRKIPRVIESYKEFRFKRKRSGRAHPNTMNIKSYKNKDVVNNCVMSYTFNNNPEVPTAGEVVTDCTTSMTVILDVKRTKTEITLGGIVFSPMLGGILVQVSPTKVDSLHVRVASILPNSSAKKAGVTTQMYVKTLALVNSETSFVHEKIFMGVRSCHSRRTELEQEGDKFRGSSVTPPKYVLDLEAVMNKLDDVISNAITNAKRIQVEFVQYKP